MATTFDSSRAPNSSLQFDVDHNEHFSAAFSFELIGELARYHRSSRLGNFFKPFESLLDFEDDGIQVSDHYHWRYLGMSCLNSDMCGFTDVSFFQIFESKTKQMDRPLTPITEHSSKSPTLTLANTTTTAKISDMSTSPADHDHSTSHSEGFHNNYTIVISLDTQIFKPSKHQQYYIFPCDSIVETVNESPPYELFCSFYTLSFIQGLKSSDHNNDASSSSHTNASLSNDQDCHSSLPSLPSLQTGTPEIKMEQGINHRSASIADPSIVHISLSGISKDLHSIIKETVAPFETNYRNMMQLMKLHTECISNRHSELLVVGGTNGTTKKISSEVKPGKSKRKGSTQHRQSPPSPSSANITSTTAALSSKTNSTLTSSDAFESINMKPKSLSVFPPSSSHIATSSSSNSAPPTTLSAPPLSTTTTTDNNSQRHNAANGRKCIYCHATKTPMWRRGPEGAGTLCNACGVKWKNGKILSELGSVLGSASAPTPGSTKAAEAANHNISASKVQQKKKRKQHAELKIQQGKRIKIRKQQRFQASKHEHGHLSGVIGSTRNEEFGKFDDIYEEEEDGDVDIDVDDDDNGYDDDADNDDMDVDKHIPASRHLSIDKAQHRHPTMSSYHLSPLPPHSRSRSMTTSMAPGYLGYQQQQQQQQHPSEIQQRNPHPFPMDEQHHHHQQQQQQQQQQRPRRHTTDVSILDRAPWGEYPLSMGVDAVEAATVLTLLKRS